MISELQPIWTQFEETYSAIRESLSAVPDDRLHWSPMDGAWTPATLAHHIARANRIYSQMIRQVELVRIPLPPNVERTFLVEMLDSSEAYVREAFQSVTEERAHVQLDTDWQPLGPLVEGSLDAVWFALQIVRHSAYHLGQLNFLMELGGFAIEYT